MSVEAMAWVLSLPIKGKQQEHLLRWADQNGDDWIEKIPTVIQMSDDEYAACLRGLNRPGVRKTSQSKSYLQRFGDLLIARDGRRCAYCYRDPQQEITVDHVIPKAKGGKDDTDNLVISCRSCNSKKRDREILYLECGG